MKIIAICIKQQAIKKGFENKMFSNPFSCTGGETRTI